MTHRALAQEGPDLRREDISISPPRRRRHRHKGLAPSRSNAVEDSRLGRLSHWPVLPRPQLAGFQVSTEGVIDQLRRLALSKGGSIPALAVTAHWDRYTSKDAKDAGFDAFLTKPVDPFDLCRTVASLVGR